MEYCVHDLDTVIFKYNFTVQSRLKHGSTFPKIIFKVIPPKSNVKIEHQRDLFDKETPNVPMAPKCQCVCLCGCSPTNRAKSNNTSN